MIKKMLYNESHYNESLIIINDESHKRWNLEK